ncbi:MAG TPA: MFS transporter, partial [Rhizobacter sp.]|nr:MFS transporter [Rhizobacter sp.]
SLFVVGVAAAVVQGFLLRRLLGYFGASRLAIIGLVSSTLSYLLWGLSTEGWMMYAVIACNLFGATVAANFSSMVSNAADAKSQGQTMGSVASLTSLTAVIAPMIGAPLLGIVSHLPSNDWRIGAPFFFCAALMLAATLLALRHFARQAHPPATPAASSAPG